MIKDTSAVSFTVTSLPIKTLAESRVAQLDSDPSIPPLSSVVPAQIGLPRRTVLRTAYAFREPNDAWGLGTDAAELTLKIVQDEVARVRLRECKVFRGLRTMADVASCAGYEIDEPVLLECLNGGSCMPPAAAKAHAGAILLGVRMRARDLASDAYIPRPFSDAPGSFGALVDTYKACAADEATADDPGSCLALRSIPPELRRQADCLLQPGATNKMKCLVPDGLAAHAIDQLSRCVERGGRSCALEAALPPDLACVASAQSVEDLQCLTPKLGGDAARLARCFSNGHDDVASRVLCVAGDNVLEPVRRVVGCYSSASSEAAVATCVLQASLPPEQAAVVRCAVESGGDVVAAGVCVAVPRLGLKNPGQQIMLQCAASSGGVPATAAACIVGRFTLIELQGCRAAEFGKRRYNSKCRLVHGPMLWLDWHIIILWSVY